MGTIGTRQEKLMSRANEQPPIELEQPVPLAPQNR